MLTTRASRARRRQRKHSLAESEECEEEKSGIEKCDQLSLYTKAN